jgi:hypothetical protein
VARRPGQLEPRADGPSWTAGTGTLIQLGQDVSGLLPDDGTRQAIPIAVIIAVIQALVPILQACAKTPTDGLYYLRPPAIDPLGIRWAIRVRRIRAAIAQEWTGERSRLGAVQDAIVARINKGVWWTLVNRLYAEAGV